MTTGRTFKFTYLALWAALVAAAALLVGAGAPPAHTINWTVGRLTVSKWVAAQPLPADQLVVDRIGNRVTEAAAHWNIEVADEVELGLRSDGVVVWRPAGKKPTTESQAQSLPQPDSLRFPPTAVDAPVPAR